MLSTRMRRYVERALEAGVVTTVRIILYRVSGYMLYPHRLLNRLWTWLKPPPKFDEAADRRPGHGQSRFLLLWGDDDLRRLQPESAISRDVPRREAMDRADAFLRGELSFLGWGRIATSVPPPWHSDVYRGIEWPLKFHKRINCVRRNSECDVKVPWEVSRMQFLPWLGQAWLISGNPVYVARLWEILRDWIIKNPPGYGVNWTSSMEVSIRAINIAAAANLVGARLTPAEEQWIRRVLLAHYTHILFNPEFSDVNGNHFLFDLLGVAVLSIVLFGSASRRTRRHVRRLIAETLLQFHPDGVHIEHATGYQRLVTDALVFFLLVCKRQSIEIPDEYEATVRSALHFLESICTRDGSIPLMGDSDSGNLLLLGAGRGNDVRPLLQAGEILLGGANAGAKEPILEESAWLFPALNGKQADLPERSDKLTTHSFPESGYFIARNAETVLCIRCGVSGLRGRGSHDHNDQLSFTLSPFGLPFIIDPGTSNYTFREADHVGDLSTFRHNTITVNGREQSPIRMGSVTQTVRSASAACHRFGRAETGRIEFRGKINGYERDNSGLSHERSIEVLDDSAHRLVLKVTDTVHSASVMKIDCIAMFMLHPSWKIVEASPNASEFRLQSDHAIAHIAFEGGHGGPFVSAESYSPEYGARIPCCAIRTPFSGADNALLVTVLDCSRAMPSPSEAKGIDPAIRTTVTH
jgi:hypothetical protein